MSEGSGHDRERRFTELSARLVHDVSTPLAIARMNNEFIARHLPALLDAYRRQLEQQPDPDAISTEHLDAIDRAPALIQEQCTRMEQAVKAYWRSVDGSDGATTGLVDSEKSGPVIGPAAQILLVEDEAIHQQIALKVLSPAYQVDVAGSGREALSHCESRPYDLVLLDICLPDLDGRQLTRQIRRTHAGDLCIIALSNMPVSEAELRQAGFDGFLEKPLKLDAFKQCLRDVRPQTHVESPE